MIGSNASLTPRGSQMLYDPVKSAQPSPRPAPPTPWVQKPQYIDMNTTEGAVNNTMARGYQAADNRFNLKQTDRAGISRGKGQQYIAAQGGAQAIAQAASQAGQTRAEDDKANAQMRAGYEQQIEQERQNRAMNQYAMDQADWARRFAQQQAAFNVANTASRGRSGWLDGLLT